jgi:hypothetical protein
MIEALRSLRDVLDRHVIGHDEMKDAVLLALVCREHLYLVGDVVLERQPLGDGRGERIHHRIEPGGILTAEVCVLDDISRAPGEALNILLRILNERMFGETPLPLLTAIATGNPMEDEYYNEPLDPANLDRFALQLRVDGLISSSDREGARLLVDRYVAGEVIEHPAADRGSRRGARRPVGNVPNPGRRVRLQRDERVAHRPQLSRKGREAPARSGAVGGTKSGRSRGSGRTRVDDDFSRPARSAR